MRKPFPIVETGIVVGVLLLAVMLILPLLARLEEPSPLASCRNSIRQVGLAVKQYAQDFNDVYPWRVGRTDPREAWRDLGIVYPNYCSGFGSFICPSSRDRTVDAPEIKDNDYKMPLDPFDGDTPPRISYAYGVDARAEPVAVWTESANSTVRLIADKKAGTSVGSSDNPVDLANHRDAGRNVLFQDAHVEWIPGGRAIDPDGNDDVVGDPDASSYRRWWSDPPYRGE